MYTCKFFDGISTHEHIATVEFISSGFSVVYTDHYGEQQNLCWRFDDIKSVEIPWPDFISIKAGTYPCQVIEATDREFIRVFKTNNAGQIPLYQRLMDSLGPKSVWLSLFIVIMLIAATYFWLIPVIAEQAALHFPITYEKQLGDGMYHNAMEFEEIDSAKTQLANTFAKHLSLSEKYPIEITVISSDYINAYAVPGGNIVIYTGLLDQMTDPKQLVALLGHEVAHIEQRHSLKILFKDLANYLAISIVLGDINGISSILLDHANQLNHLSYSRKLEEEADLHGMELMSRNQINPQGMVMLMKVLDANHEGGIIPEFLSTHPVTTSRIACAEENLKNFSQAFHESPALDSLFTQLTSSYK